MKQVILCASKPRQHCQLSCFYIFETAHYFRTVGHKLTAWRQSFILKVGTGCRSLLASANLDATGTLRGRRGAACWESHRATGHGTAGFGEVESALPTCISPDARVAEKRKIMATLGPESARPPLAQLGSPPSNQPHVGCANLPPNRGLERALEEAAASGVLNLSCRKLKEFPRTAANHDLSDTVEAGTVLSALLFLKWKGPERCH